MPPEDLQEEILSDAVEAKEEGSTETSKDKKSQGENKPKFVPLLDYDLESFNMKENWKDFPAC